MSLLESGIRLEEPTPLLRMREAKGSVEGEGLERLCTSGSWSKAEERVGGQSGGRNEREEGVSKGEEDEWESNA